jgi:glutathione S-transferase
MQLYYYPLSSNSRKALVTAIILGSPIERKLVDLTKREQRQPDFLKLNPNGRVPVLVDEELTLWESHAIMTYLADKARDHTLYPQDLRQRADVNRWLFWASSHFIPAVAALFYENVLKAQRGLGLPDLNRVEQANADLRGSAQILDIFLQKHQFIAGNHLTLADISVACSMMTTVAAHLPVQDYPDLQSWFTRVQALDAWKETMPVPHIGPK